MTKWPVARIGDICSLFTGGTPSKAVPEYFDGGEVPWLVSGDVNRGEILECDGRITELGLSKSNAKYLPLNSVVIALAGQGKTRGTVAILRIKATCNQSVVAISPKDEKQLMPEFLLWNLRGRYVEIRRLSGDDERDRRGLNMDQIKAIEIPLPPIDEQKRIVAKLDQALGYVDELTATTKASTAQSHELWKSALNSSMGPSVGDETKKLAQLGDVARLVNGRAYKKHELLDEGKYRVLRVGNFFSNDHWYWSDLELEDNKYCSDGDLLYAWSASFGPRIWVGEKTIFHYHIWKVDFDDNQVVRDWLKYWFEWDVEQIKSTSGVGTTMMHVTKGAMESRELIVPTLHQQQEIVNKLDRLRTELSGLQSNTENVLLEGERLRSAILSSAFAGDL
jgi:type I restriction enzyme S subunit